MGTSTKLKLSLLMTSTTLEFTLRTERIKDSILTFSEQKQKKQTEADVVYTFERLVCKENSPWDWTNLSHKATLLKDYIPQHLKHRVPQIIRAFDTIYSSFLALNLQEAKERFSIIINGDSGTHKTKLSKMIVKKLAASKLIVSENSYVLWKQQDLSDKLPRTDGKEVVILDDYDGDNHKLGVYDALTGEDETRLRVMGDYETTRYIKGTIIPTVDALENWITSKTGTLREFKQLCRRSDCNLYIFAPKHVKNPEIGLMLQTSSLEKMFTKN